MSLYKVKENKLEAIERTTFASQRLKERDDLQKMLKNQPEIVDPEILIVSEEFGDWEDSRRRIDLLGVHKDGSLIVVELKRTEDGGFMDLQSLRYAAMISTLTFEKLIPIYSRYLQANNRNEDATNNLLKHLEWNDPDEKSFANEVKIILISDEFSKELTTTVLWLNDCGIDIRCIRALPYVNNGEVLIDVQTIIPIP